MVLPTGTIINAPVSIQTRVLKKQGYQVESFDDDIAEYVHPEQPGKALWLALKPGVTRHFLDAARIVNGNPLFPRVDHAEEFSGGMHKILTDRLYRAEDLPVDPQERIVYQGIARAFASFMEGDKAHIDAHREMGKDYHLMQAALHIARVVRAQLAVGENPVQFDASSASIGFRKTEQGEYRPVFARAFSSATHQQATAQCLHFCQRFDLARINPKVIRESQPAVLPGPRP